MGDYYASAVCCISASSACDSSQGFLTPRVKVRYPIQAATFRLVSLDKSFSTVYTEVSQETTDADDALRFSPLMGRGWYLQELVLSRRILHWTEFGLARECPSSRFVEGSRYRLKDSPWYIPYNPRASLAVTRGGQVTIDDWNRLLETFSGMTLSHIQDRQYAILGLAAFFSQRLGTSYTHGIFTDYIASGLAWELLSNDSLPPQPRFPSWSWASQPSVMLFGGQLDPAYPCVSHRIPASPMGTELRSGSGAVQYLHKSKLFVEGDLFRVSLNEKSVLLQRGIDKQWSRVDGKYTLEKPISELPSPKTPGITHQDDLVLHWLLLGKLLNPFKNKEQYRGILLSQVENQGNDAYRRVGFMSVNEEQGMGRFIGLRSDITLV